LRDARLDPGARGARRRAAARIGAAAVALLAVAAVVRLAPPLLSSAPDDWNLLLVTLDTTRADRLGAYGYRHAETPALDALAEQGVRWERCYAPAPLTLPSHASILTGLVPIRHGIHANGREVLVDGAQTLAEILRERGWSTGAVVGAFVLDRRFGLAQGFEHYDDDLAGADEPPRFGYTERDASRVTDAALAWLERSAGRPWLLWVHYFDPHSPYAAPGFNAKLSPQSPYDAEITYADSQLARLLGFLEETGKARRTLVVVTADHGEGLWEHGESTHALFAYDSTLRVPLIVRFPDGRGAGSVVSERAALVDLLPSVLGWLGQDAPSGLDGRALRLENAPPVATEPETRAIYFENEGPAHLFGWSRLRGVVAGRDKLIVAPRPELYDIEDDPRETRNLWDPSDARSRAARARFDAEVARLAAAPRLVAEAAGLDEEGRAKLLALGYLSADAANRDGGEADRADPKDRVDVFQRVQLAMALIGQERAVEGVEMLVEVVTSDDPGNRRALTILSSLALDSDEAARQRAIEGLSRTLGRPTGDRELDLAVRDRLALAHAREGRFDEAIAVLRGALEIDPDSIGVHWRLARVREQAGAPPDEILPHLERVAAATPDDAAVHYRLGLAWERSGDPGRAARELHRALDLAQRGTDAPAWVADARGRVAPLDAAAAP
jgi:arylsulfatase A-like enzyme